MLFFQTWVFVCAVVLCAGAPERVFSQEPAEKEQKEQEQPEEPGYEFFSGNVTESQATKLTVTRAIAGKPTEKKTFLVKAETRVEGKLKSKTRVTVGYITTEEGDVALRVVVRPPLRRR